MYLENEDVHIRLDLLYYLVMSKNMIMFDGVVDIRYLKFFD